MDLTSLDETITRQQQGPEVIKNEIDEAMDQPEKSDTFEARLAVPVNLPLEQILPGPVTDYEIMTVGGTYDNEYILQTRTLDPMGFRYVQDKGRGSATLKSWLMLRNKQTRQGIAVLLAYSGNWIIEVRSRDGETVLRMDTSPPGLKPFAEFSGMPVPGALVSQFTGHWDNGAQPIVRFIRSKLRRDLGPDWPPVQYNNWYDDFHKISESKLIHAARAAAAIGCELFTLDAGWYGKREDAKWSRQLGNWEVNKDRLPNGLEPVINEVRRLGMKFGLWVEIECASPTSDVVMEHPDWILKDGDRPVCERFALDFGKPEVLAWAKSVIDRLVTTYALDYIKMDFNTDLLVNAEGLTPETDPIYRHNRGLVELWKHMRTAHPKLIVENCASGSLRQDAMTAALTDTHWISDNVSNPASLVISFGATYLFPPEICSHWTSTPGKPGETLDTESSFTANMVGHLGLSGRIYEWGDETRKVAAERIAFYKTIRGRIGSSDVFHLTSQSNIAAPDSMQAVLYAEPQTGKGILFAFHGGDLSLEHTIVLRGLKRDRSYRLRMPEGYGPDRNASGNELVAKGLALRFPHYGSSVVILIDPE